MKQKILMGIVFLLAVSLLAGSGQATLIPRPYGCTSHVLDTGGCDCYAELKSVSYPQTAFPGQQIIATAEFTLSAGDYDTCTFLIESSVIPMSGQLAIIQANAPLCCPSNPNYAAKKVTITEFSPEQNTIQFTLTTPSTSSIDNCYIEEERSYWTGAGYYSVTFGVYNNCDADPGPLVSMLYDKSRTINIVPPATCGDGVCNPGESFENCPEDCINCPIFYKKSITGTRCEPDWLIIGLVVGIISVAIIGGVAYWKKK